MAFEFNDQFVAKWRGYLYLFNLAASLLVFILLIAGAAQSGISGGSVGFGFFASIVTLIWCTLVVGYLFKPTVFSFAATAVTHHYSDVGVAFVLCVFWLADAAALADGLSYWVGNAGWLGAFRAAAAFGFFLFFSFLALTIIIGRQVYLARFAGRGPSAGQTARDAKAAEEGQYAAPPVPQYPQQPYSEQQQQPVYAQPQAN
ncbi:hypothetical protein GQ42DRAFT_92563 [Ramicandelaber brevisporus]|nr:hypothetical protein GQ42DRAFT_92563 [Ramicandelaber brevisporus]